MDNEKYKLGDVVKDGDEILVYTISGWYDIFLYLRKQVLEEEGTFWTDREPTDKATKTNCRLLVKIPEFKWSGYIHKVKS